MSTTTQNTQKYAFTGNEDRYTAKSRTGTKIHIGESGGSYAMCGARVVPYATRHTEITCTTCAKNYGLTNEAAQ